MSFGTLQNQYIQIRFPLDLPMILFSWKTYMYIYGLVTCLCLDLSPVIEKKFL